MVAKSKAICDRPGGVEPWDLNVGNVANVANVVNVFGSAVVS